MKTISLGSSRQNLPTSSSISPEADMSFSNLNSFGTCASVTGIKLRLPSSE